DWPTFRDCDDCPEMVVIAPGTFLFGRGADRVGSGRHPMVQVTIDRPYALGRYEITIGEWNLCVAAGRCDDVEDDLRPDPGPEYPRGLVGWRGANEYAAWLSEVTGQSYGLPSATEWEWAVRNDQPHRWSWGERPTDARANLGLDEIIGIVPVGRYPPNINGLHDVDGNVSEFVLDCYTEDDSLIPTDGSPYMPETCKDRVTMGRHYWGTPMESLGLIGWHGFWTGLNDGNSRGAIGFRLARELTDEEVAALPTFYRIGEP
ncbi:MAG: formylglycine-generating enzyme family protein, partial [Symploca sp. SIO2G7]|nr:formylglycine-generating enzyme family protein [Symploca sp. SIO2G7]